MPTTFFSEAVTFIADTMIVCAYARRVSTELREMETRYNENDMSASDLFLLKNIRVIIQCAVEDHEWGDEVPGTQAHEYRRKNTTFDRNCLQKEAQAAKLHAELDTIIKQVETWEAAQSLQPSDPVQVFRSRLEQVRQQAHTLEQTLGAILGEAGDASRSRKRALDTEPVATHMTGMSKRMADLLRQIE